MERKLLPPDFDWVTARHRCSAAKFFERLYLGAQRNMETRNALVQERGERLLFEITQDGIVFSVLRPIAGGIAIVRFRLDGDRISVEGQGVRVACEGTITLNHQAECRLKVGDQELDEWQVLRCGLETLFFGL